MNIRHTSSTAKLLGECENCAQGMTHLGPTSDVRIHEIVLTFGVCQTQFRLCDQCFVEFQELLKEKLEL